ncbi:MAG: zinc ribbon domain-containing protein [Prevotella sp.]|nr:zinc ribbon domain-containing protein [Prevotella sp.]
MALIKCPECGHQVSDKAATCPSCGVAIAGNVKRENEVPKGKRSMTIPIVAGVVAVIAVLVGLYFYNNVQDRNELDAYENAMSCSEAAVLQNYLDMYADAPQAHRDSIMAHLALLKKVDSDWDEAMVNNTRSAFENYLRVHPESVHKTEALLKLDSIDWAFAAEADTPEAYSKYVADHADGMHIDEARLKLEKLEKSIIAEDEKLMVTSVLTSFFNALGNNDEEALTMSIDVVLNSFLHRAGATKADVISYMKRIHSPEDITGIVFRMNNDWKIEKIDLGEGECSYVVDFSVDEKIQRTDESKETFSSYKVNAKVSNHGKITDLNMKKGVAE